MQNYYHKREHVCYWALCAIILGEKFVRICHLSAGFGFRPKAVGKFTPYPKGEDAYFRNDP